MDIKVGKLIKDIKIRTFYELSKVIVYVNESNKPFYKYIKDYRSIDAVYVPATKKNYLYRRYIKRLKNKGYKIITRLNKENVGNKNVLIDTTFLFKNENFDVKKMNYFLFDKRKSFMLLYVIDKNEEFSLYYKDRKIYKIYEEYNGFENNPFNEIIMCWVFGDKNFIPLKVESKSMKENQFIEGLKVIQPNIITDKLVVSSFLKKIEIDYNVKLTKQYVEVIGNELLDLINKEEKIKDIIINHINDDINSPDNKSIITKLLYNMKNDYREYFEKMFGVEVKNITQNLDMKTFMKYDLSYFKGRIFSSLKNIFTELELDSEEDFSESFRKGYTEMLQKFARENIYENNIEKFREDSFNKMLIGRLYEIFNSKATEKEAPLILIDMKIKDASYGIKEYHMNASEYFEIELTFRLANGTQQKITLRIPKMKNGYFVINGKRKVLSTQIIPPPVFFPQPHRCALRTTSKLIQILYTKTRIREMLYAVFAGTNQPLLTTYIYWLGFKEAMNYIFGKRNWEILPKKNKDYNVYIELQDGYINIKANDKYKEILAKSYDKKDFKHVTIDLMKQPNPEMVMVEMQEKSSELNRTRLIFDTFLDEITKDILKETGYPNDLKELLLEVVPKTVDGFVQSRNDLNKLRLRNSEILYNIIQHTFLKAYSDYRNYVRSGKKNYRLDLKKNSIISKFLTNSLVQTSEYSNIIEDIAQKQKVTFTGTETGGLKPDAVGFDMRDISETYYGIIDPVETPIYGNVGVVQHLLPTTIIKDEMGRVVVKPMSDDNKKILGTTASLLPYIEYNDTTRLTMASNQVKQSVQLINGDEPLVQTGNEMMLKDFASDVFVKRSPADGKIISVKDDKKIVIKDLNSGKLLNISIEPIYLHSGSGLSGYQEFRVLVGVGDKVKKGQIIAESKYSFSKTGNLIYGNNFCTTFMIWEGWNFEDGIVISDSIIKNKKFVSPKTYEIEAYLTPKECGTFAKPNIKLNKKYEVGEELFEYIPKSLDSINNFIKLGSIKNGIIKVESKGGVLYDVEGYIINTKNISDDLRKLAKRYGFTIKNGVKFYDDKNELVNGLLIRFKFASLINVTVGDKFSNRHGNKGVICYIEKEENMPVTPWGDKVEIILSPIGIAKRNNFGQLFELYTGLMAKKLLDMTKTMPKKRFALFLKKFYDIMDKTPRKSVRNYFVQFVNMMSEKDYKNLNKIFKIGFPIIVKQFYSPGPKDIDNALRLMGLKDGYKLYLPKYKQYTSKDVPVGYMYISLLEHMSSKKLKARGQGKLSYKIGTPVKTKEEGAQRLGEYDSYALYAHGAEDLLDSIWQINSDNIILKNYVVGKIMQSGEVSVRDIDAAEFLALDDKSSTSEYVKYLFLTIGIDIS